MMQKIRWFLLLVGIILGLAVIFQNNNDTPELKVLFWTARVSLPLLLLTTTAIGFVLGSIMTYGMLRPRKGISKEKAPVIEKKGAGKGLAAEPERTDALAPDAAKAP